MALWQFSISLTDLAEQSASDVETIFSKILPAAISWDDNLFVFGNTQGNDIQVYLEDDNAVAIQIRFNLNEYTNQHLIKIVNAARLLGCKIQITDTGEIINRMNSN